MDEPIMLEGRARASGRSAAAVGLLLNAVLMTASELMTRYGASLPADPQNVFARMGLPAVASAWTWAGTGVAIGAMVLWLWVLRTVPLGLAYNVTTITYVMIPVAAWLFLGERLTLIQWGGMGLVLAGVLLLVPGLVKVEEEESGGGKQG